MANFVPNVINIAHQECDGSPDEQYTERGFRAVCRYKCAWADRHTLCQELQGGVRTVGDDEIIIKAHPYPHSGAPDNVVCISAQAKKFGDAKTETEDAAQQYTSYSHAEVTAEYSTPDWTYGSGEEGGDAEVLVTETLESTTQFLTLPTTGLYWTEATKYRLQPDQPAPTMQLKQTIWTITRHRLVSVPGYVLSLSGYINSGTVTSRTYGLSFAKGSLLYEVGSATVEHTTDGESALALPMRFTYRAGGTDTWLKFPRINPTTGAVALSPIYRKTGGEYNQLRPYPYGDFSLLGIFL